MATNQENVQKIIDLEEEILQDNNFSKDFYQTKIVLLETDKEKFQEPAQILDQALFKQVKQINDLRDEVSALYDAEVTAGNISNSFWRVVGYGNDGVNTKYFLKKETLKRFYDIEPNVYDSPGSSVTPLGFSTESVMIYDGNPNITTYSCETVGGRIRVVDPNFVGTGKFIETTNKDGLKLYTEPYTEDLLETLVARSFGVIENGSDRITLLTPISDKDNPVNNIADGNIVTSDQAGVFINSDFANVINNQGVGTTIVDLSIYPQSVVGVATTTPQEVPYIRIDVTANVGFGSTNVPNDDGDFPLFEFSINPDDVNFDKFAVDFDTSAFVPQRIRVVKKKKELDGNGIKVERVDPDSGSNTKDAEWNKFLEGFPNPADLDVIVTEPDVANGKQVYVLGFEINDTAYKPKDSVSDGEYIGPLTFSNFYDSLGGNQNNATIDDKKAEVTLAVEAWKNSDKTQARFDLSNAFKEQINEINTEIWGMRAQLGKADEIITSKKQFKQLILDSDVLNLLDNPDDI